LEHKLNAICFLSIHYEALILCGIAVRGIPTIPKAFLRPLIHLVPGSIRRHFPLELRKVEENVAQEATMGFCVSRLLGDGIRRWKSLTERVSRSIL
jgi:hypothetical protein